MGKSRDLAGFRERPASEFSGKVSVSAVATPMGSGDLRAALLPLFPARYCTGKLKVWLLGVGTLFRARVFCD